MGGTAIEVEGILKKGEKKGWDRALDSASLTKWGNWGDPYQSHGGGGINWGYLREGTAIRWRGPDKEKGREGGGLIFSVYTTASHEGGTLKD